MMHGRKNIKCEGKVKGKGTVYTTSLILTSTLGLD